MKHLFSTILLLSLLVHQLHAQSKDTAAMYQFAQGLINTATPDYVTALPVLDTLCHRAPENAGYAYALGQCYAELRGNKSGMPYFTKAVTLAPNNLEYRSCRAVVWMLIGKPDSCVQDAYKLISTLDACADDVANSNMFYQLGYRNLWDAYNELNQYDSALKYVVKEVEVAGESVYLLNTAIKLLIINGNHDAVEEVISRAEAYGMSKGLTTYYNLLNYMRSGNYTAAKYVAEIFEDNNIDVVLKEGYYTAVGLVYINLGDIDAAMKYTRKARKMKKNYMAVYRNLAIIYLKQGDIEKACKNFDLAQQYAHSYYNLLGDEEVEVNAMYSLAHKYCGG